MKRVLITGAAGNLGVETIKQLLTNKDYEITALDLKSLRSSKRLKKYKKRINIIYGDINDELLINSVVEDKDIVIHLASVLPPIANLESELTNLINVDGLINVVNAINYKNKNIFMVYSSSICVYGDRTKNPIISVNDKANTNMDNPYAVSKISAENIIKKSIKNYSIFRFTAIMGSRNIDSMMYDIPLDSKFEIITLKDAARAIVKSLDNINRINKKTFNVGDGEKSQTTYREFLIKLLQIRGLSFSVIKSFLIEDRNYYCGYFSDSKKLNDIISYQTDDLKEYYRRLKKATKPLRIVNRVLALPFIYFLKRGKK